jgi:ribosome-binding protein aMBF1 (putative translation factor)
MTTITKNEFKDKKLLAKKLSKLYKEAANPQKEQPEIIKEIGKAIIERRKAKNWTVQKLADETGIHRPNLTKMEGGKTNFTIESLQKIAQAMGCRLEVNFVRLKNSNEE